MSLPKGILEAVAAAPTAVDASFVFFTFGIIGKDFQSIRCGVRNVLKIWLSLRLSAWLSMGLSTDGAMYNKIYDNMNYLFYSKYQ